MNGSHLCDPFIILQLIKCPWSSWGHVFVTWGHFFVTWGHVFMTRGVWFDSQWFEQNRILRKPNHGSASLASSRIYLSIVMN